MSTYGTVGFILAMTLMFTGPGCKPADEPRRQPVAGESGNGASKPPAQASTGTTGTIRLVAPGGTTSTDTGTGTTGDDGAGASEQTDAGPQPGDEPPTATDADGARALERAKRLGLTDAVLAQLTQVPSEAQRKAAEAASRRGLKLHRKLELDGAVQAYEAGLKEWPGHIFSRYNLACARALQNAPKAALQHLAALSVIQDNAAVARLRAARTDPDFESLHADDDFRALTRFIPVEVSWSPSRGDGSAAVSLVDALRRVHIPAHQGREWRKDLTDATLYVAINDKAAQHVANEIEAGTTAPLKRVDSRFLNAARPIVLVLGTAGDSPTPTASAASSIDELLDLTLRARHDGREEELRLKRTGFFNWTVRQADGTRQAKTGRYALQKGSLHLDFRMTTERPGNPPQVEVEQGRRENHTVSIEAGALLVGNVRFER